MCSVSKNQTVFNNTSGLESLKAPEAHIESMLLISKASAALLLFPFLSFFSIFQADFNFSPENANLVSRRILYSLYNSCVKWQSKLL